MGIAGSGPLEGNDGACGAAEEQDHRRPCADGQGGWEVPAVHARSLPLWAIEPVLVRPFKEGYPSPASRAKTRIVRSFIHSLPDGASIEKASTP